MNENEQVPSQNPTVETQTEFPEVISTNTETENVGEPTGEIPKKEEKPKKKKSPVHLIGNIIFVILLIIILAEAILGFVNMNAIGNDKKPVFCFDEKEEIKKNEKVTTYHLGLYKIVHTETKEKTVITLKPFFLD